ncbi:MAG: hypothetical protein IJ011_06100 [Clostridia bacterium]|nr:hypothetical protein [Clostridia bacterium]
MKRKFFDVSLIAAAYLLLFGLGLGVILLPKEDFSEEENRMLATLELPTFAELVDGSFSSAVGELYRDRLPLRTSFTAAKAYAELMLFKGENNGVLFCRDGYLLEKGEYDDLGTAKKNIEYFSELEAICRELGVPFVCAVAPRGIDVMEYKLPEGYRGKYGEIWGILESSGIEYLSLTEPLRSAAEAGEYVWYRTDHHWTSYGAYIAYRELADALGYSPYGADAFAVCEASDGFLGSVYSKAGCVAQRSDSVQLYRYTGDEDFTVRIGDSGEEREGFYFTEKLSTKDKYAVFLGGNYSELYIEKSGGEERERMLLIKDSYANAVSPFLALHFDIELVDLRYFEGGRDALCEKIGNADKVLLLHGIDTVATTRLY